MPTEFSALQLRDDPNIKNLLNLLNDPRYQSEKQEFNSILGHVDELTNSYNSIMEKLDAMNKKLNAVTDKKNPLSIIAEHLYNIVSGIGEKLKALKDSIIDFAKNTVEAVKDKGMSALGSVSETLHISEGLEAISKGLDKAAEKCENLEQFHYDRVESKLLTEFEIPADLDSLSKDELKTVYAKLIDIGMDGDLSSYENAIVQDLMEEIEEKTARNQRF